MRRKHRKHVFIQNKFQNIIFLREYRRERSEFDVGPGLKFINTYIKVALNLPRGFYIRCSLGT